MTTKRQTTNFNKFVKAIKDMPPKEWNFAHVRKETSCGSTGCSVGLLPQVWPKEFKYQDVRIAADLDLSRGCAERFGTIRVVKTDFPAGEADSVSECVLNAALGAAVDRLSELIGISTGDLNNILLAYDAKRIEKILPLEDVPKEFVIARLNVARRKAKAAAE